DAIVIFRNGRGFDVEVPFRTASVAEATQIETPANRRARELVAQYPGQSDAELEAAFKAATDEGAAIAEATVRQRDGQDIRTSLLERQQGDLTGIQVTNAAG
ncbi:hypothetical protein, partial [Priestia megaterium]|uniref:hypothetical protein n=1 Tax=Priestia megaterium TaxID=1404 RepID=UPI0035B60BC9